jgi:hypothetical protein
MVTEKKSLAVQIMTILILLIGAYTGLFSSEVQAWLGIAAMALTLTLSTFFPTGTLPKQWTAIMWITNVSGVIMQLLNALGSQGLVDAQTINIVMIAINVIMQTVVKQYETPAGK